MNKPNPPSYRDTNCKDVTLALARRVGIFPDNDMWAVQRASDAEAIRLQNADPDAKTEGLAADGWQQFLDLKTGYGYLSDKETHACCMADASTAS